MPTTSITLKDYLTQVEASISQRTLCFLRQGDQILLGRRKRGFGQDRFVGIGGRVEAGETLQQATIRETIEEVGLHPLQLTQVATITFLFPHADQPSAFNQHVEVYTSTAWQGQLSESDEIEPAWFKRSQIPYHRMWPDAAYWLPAVLNGQHLKAIFLYDRQINIHQYEITQNKPQ